MIRHNGTPILGVEYECSWEGEVVELIGPQQGGMATVLGKLERNPGMTVVAVTFHNRGEEDGHDRVEVERRAIR